MLIPTHVATRMLQGFLPLEQANFNTPFIGLWRGDVVPSRSTRYADFDEVPYRIQEPLEEPMISGPAEARRISVRWELTIPNVSFGTPNNRPELNYADGWCLASGFGSAPTGLIYAERYSQRITGFRNNEEPPHPDPRTVIVAITAALDIVYPA